MVSKFFILLSLFVSACASNPRIENLSSKERQRVSAIKVFRGEADRPVTLLGTVDGLSCHRNAYSTNDVGEEEAMEGVKIKAALLQADAIVNVVCQKNSGTDWMNNCFGSVKCIGDAASYQ
ncbi:MAG: hypothetical protein K2Q18_18690 [Bdellovibrionales bacterium]|nr:hypothetical protein [Bdellovibrionales bacterium]